MIFINFSVRNSRVTGPKIRVPTGASLAFNITAEFTSKRIKDPSGRLTPFLVRTYEQRPLSLPDLS